MVILVTIYLVVVGTSLLVYKLLSGPSYWDRLIALNLMNSKMIMLIVLYGTLQKDLFYVDVAFVFAMIGFIATSLLARFLESEGEDTSHDL